jgi:hypothetical protein
MTDGSKIISAKQHIPAIDFLKGAAILAITVLHSINGDSVVYSALTYFGISCFVILLGTNASFSGIILFTKEYFLKKATRLLIPLIPVLITLYFTIGIQNGLGIYFIVLVFQAIIIIPLLQRVTIISQLFALTTSFLISVLFENITYPFGLTYNQIPIARWLFALTLGIVLVNIIREKKPVYLALLIPIFLIPVNASIQYELSLVFIAGLIFAATYFEISTPIMDTLGKASYHIFLMNTLYHIFWNYGVVVNTVLIVTTGVILYCINNSLSHKSFSFCYQ